MIGRSGSDTLYFQNISFPDIDLIYKNNNKNEIYTDDDIITIAEIENFVDKSNDNLTLENLLSEDLVNRKPK